MHDLERLSKRLQRERSARIQAEELLEQKSRELYEANQQLLQAHDILEERVQERTRQLEDAVLRAEEAVRAKSEFLANMSHEIRTPMTAIKGFSETLLYEGDLTLAPKQRIEAIEAITRNGDHLLTIINDILDLSKIEADKMTVEAIDVSPYEVVHDVVDLLEVRADGKQIKLLCDFPVPLPRTIKTDPTRLRQILLNLVGNAIKFSEEGQVQLSASYDPEVKETICFAVKDSGIGMNEDQLARMFQPFTQADTSTTREFGGTGLGLAISLRLAQLLGGSIVPQCRSGEGCEFRVNIVTGSLSGIEFIDEETWKNERSQFVDQRAWAPVSEIELNCRVLVVDDRPDNRLVVSHVLSKAGAQIEFAENGATGFEKALAALSDERPFDVILMDMQMPVLDGYAATRELRERGYTRPIIALTANAMSSDREKCLAAGCDDFTTKPINRHELLMLVKEYSESLCAVAGHCDAPAPT